ncbi:MAG: quinolinate synthase NadA, partial [Pedobacter sp.]
PYMKRNTLEKLYLCLKNERPEVTVPEHIITAARKPIERMLEMSASLGL